MNNTYLNLMIQSLSGSLDTRMNNHWKFDFINSPASFNQLMSAGSVRTMIGRTRLENLFFCIDNLIHDNIKGDLLEAGCWRGGAVIFMKACLNFLQNQRTLWCADLFPNNAHLLTNQSLLIIIKLLTRYQSYLPSSLKNWTINKIMEAFPDEHYTPQTQTRILQLASILPWKKCKSPLNTSVDDLKEAFIRYNLLDDDIRFLPGWFDETLPEAKKEITQLALLRVDADFYASTKCVLENLYPKLVVGGYCIIDDYGAFPECKRAVDEYRQQHNINDDLISIDNIAYYFRRK